MEGNFTELAILTVNGRKLCELVEHRSLLQQQHLILRITGDVTVENLSLVLQQPSLVL